MRLLLLADTHVRADGRPPLPAGLLDALGAADVILHAGDVVTRPLLDRLSTHAPVHAVLGNNDTGLDLPPTLEVRLDGVQVAMVHDAGRSEGRAARLRRRFPDAGLVVFGHSHIPLVVPAGEALLVNPGSPTYRRRQPVATFATVVLGRGRVAGCTVHEATTGRPVTPPGGPPR